MPQPNVLLVTIDCLRQDRCGFAGHHRNTTPTLDSMATESVVFKNAHSPGPRTSESVPGIISGRLSADCAYLDRLSFKAIPSDAETLATWLGSQGYETVAAVSNPQLSPVRNFGRGFEYFNNLRINQEGDRFESLVQEDQEDETGASLVFTIGKWLMSLGDRAPVNPTVLAYIIHQYAQLFRTWPTVDGSQVISDLTSKLSNVQKPFFAWTHLNDLHAPLHPERVRTGGLLNRSNLRQFLYDSRRARHIPNAHYGWMYDSAIRYVDIQLRILFDYLKEIGEYENTLIIVTADHGEALGDRGIFEHAAGNETRMHDKDRDYLYRELLNIPLVLRHPSGESAAIRSPFSLTWLHQAMAEILDLPPGNFNESYGGSYMSPSGTVFADALTEQGHTIAAITDTTKVLTDGTTPEEVNIENWYQFDIVDEGERMWTSVDIDLELTKEIKANIVSPDSLRSLEDNLSSSREEQLADLGYL